MSRRTARVLRMALLGAVACTGFACSNDTMAPERLPGTAAVMAGPQTITGKIGPGALYGLYLPAAWNGDLLLFAHGWTAKTVPLALPGGNWNVFRDSLLARGYGVAWSTWSEYGMSLQDGVTRTRQLHGLFTEAFGRPAHTYLYGYSLGAAVVMELAETSKGKFDGVITESGIVGGLPYQLAHYFTIRTLFDYFYPGVLQGDAVTIPDGLVLAAQDAVVRATIANDPAPAYELAVVDQAHLVYTSLPELTNAIAMPLMFNSNVLFTGEILERTNGHAIFDNRAVMYTGSPNDAALNAGVARYAADPAGLNEIRRMYTPNGKLTLPVLNMHYQRDPVVPLSHTAEFADLVVANGVSDLLFQWTPDRVGHGSVPLAEKLLGVAKLAAWVKTGVRPTWP